MNLKPFSLGSSTPKKENNIPQQNDGIKRYIELNEKSGYPTLYIEDPKKSSKITLSFLAGYKLQATKENTETHDKIVGEPTSSINFKSSEDNSKVRDLIMLGFICEALFFAGISLEDITGDINLLSQFSNKGLKTGYYGDAANIDFSTIVPFIEIQKTLAYPIVHSVMKKAVLTGKSDKHGLLCKGVIGTTHNCVYLQTDCNNCYKIDYPDFFKSMKESDYYYESVKDSDLYHTAITSLFWVLLSSLHFYGYEVFDLCNDDINLNLTVDIVADTPFVTPINLGTRFWRQVHNILY